MPADRYGRVVYCTNIKINKIYWNAIYNTVNITEDFNNV